MARVRGIFILVLATCGALGLASGPVQMGRPIAKTSTIRRANAREQQRLDWQTSEAEKRSLISRLRQDERRMRREHGLGSETDDSLSATSLSTDLSTPESRNPGDFSYGSLRARAKEENRWRNGLKPSPTNRRPVPQAIDTVSRKEAVARQRLAGEAQQQDMAARLAKLQRENRRLRGRLADAGLLEGKEAADIALDAEESSNDVSLEDTIDASDADPSPSPHAMTMLRMAERACRKDGMQVESMKVKDVKLAQFKAESGRRPAQGGGQGYLASSAGGAGIDGAGRDEGLSGLDWSQSIEDDL